MRYLLGRIWLGLFGWRVEGIAPLPERLVLVAYPHTSNWDLPFLLAAAWVLRAQVSWLGKLSLFRNPVFGRFLRRLGGIPVDRGTRTNTVATIAARFRELSSLILVVPVEATRGRTDYWKSGFYHIAASSGVPIGLGFLDYQRRRCGVGQLLQPTGNVTADMDRIREFYRDVRGKHPGRQGIPRLREEDP
jgi:1-acyl-sn-glycerol-3-phosphate acyltransferase